MLCFTTVNNKWKLPWASCQGHFHITPILEHSSCVNMTKQICHVTSNQWHAWFWDWDGSFGTCSKRGGSAGANAALVSMGHTWNACPIGLWVARLQIPTARQTAASSILEWEVNDCSFLKRKFSNIYVPRSHAINKNNMISGCYFGRRWLIDTPACSDNLL